MKSLIKIYLTLALFISTLTVFAGVSPDYHVTPNGEHSFHLQLEKPRSSDMQISLTDAFGSILWSNEVESGQTFSKLINLNNLPTGHYSLIIEDDMKIEYQSINLEVDQIITDSKMKKTIFKPVYNYHDNIVDMIILHQSASDLKLTISDTTGEDIFSEIITGSGSVQKQYDVSQLPKGTYIFRLSTNDQNFYNLVDIK